MNERKLKRLLNKLDIKTVGKSRDWLVAQCPFAEWTHKKKKDRRPSFAIKINDRGVSGYKCLTCGMQGRTSMLVRELEHYRDIHYPGLALEADMDEVSYEDMSYEDDYEPEKKQLPKPLNEAQYEGIYPNAWDVKEAIDYLSGRGISTATAQKIGLMYDNDDKRILFPIRDDKGSLYGFSGRSVLPSGEKPSHYPARKTYPKVKDYYGLPKKFMLLGAERFTQGKPVIVVEGLFGYASLIEQGVEELANVVAILGSQLTDEKSEVLISWDESVYLMHDNDDGGDLGLFGPLDKHGKHRGGGAVDSLYKQVVLYVPDWPGDKADPDELTLNDIKEIINNTLPYFKD